METEYFQQFFFRAVDVEKRFCFAI